MGGISIFTPLKGFFYLGVKSAPRFGTDEHGAHESTMKTLKMTAQFTILGLGNCQNWGYFELHFLCIGDLQCDGHRFLSSAPWKSPKTTPDLPSLFGVQRNDVWPTLDLLLYQKWPQFDLVRVKMVIWWHGNVKSSQTTLGCWILKVQEGILWRLNGGQNEVGL